MSFGLLTIIVLACVGGLVVVYGVGKSRHTSELMLDEYRRLLEEARRAKSAPPLDAPGRKGGGS